MIILNKIFKLLFISFFSLIIHLSYATCNEGRCPISLNFTFFDYVKDNPNTATYKSQKLNNITAIASGKLKNGNQYKIIQKAGDLWTVQYSTTMTTPDKHPLKDKTYWLSQALIFSRQMMKDYFNIAQFSLSQSSEKQLLFENIKIEGMYECITIIQHQNHTTIKLIATAD